MNQMADSKTVSKHKWFVLDRHDVPQEVSFDRIRDRINELSSSIGNQPELPNVDAVQLWQDTVARFKNGMKTSEIDAIIISIALNKSMLNYEYGILASRLVISNAQKMNKLNLLQMVELVEKQGKHCRFNPEYIGLIKKYHEQFEKFVDHDRDFMFSYHGFQTLIKSYLTRRAGENTEIVESPQHMYLRVAMCTELSNREIKHMIDNNASDPTVQKYITRIQHNYNMLSRQLISNASPTLFNACTNHQQCSSCFLISVDDSLEVIMDTVKNAAMLSKWAGGLGICLTPMRSEGSAINSTGGKSSGIGKLLRLLDAEQSYASQGGLRMGAFAVYLEIWHADVVGFIQASRKVNKDVDYGETHNLKYALWVPDAFMRAVDKDADWYLMDPAQSPNLYKVYGEQFDKLYEQYIAEGKYVRKIKARTIAMEWVKSISLSGYPYFAFKDNVNKKSILSNIRTIRGSNLCCEICIPNWHDEGDSENSQYGVCVLGSIPLVNFVKPGNDRDYRKRIDFQGIMEATAKLVHNLDNLIDKNYYPHPACERSTFATRPIAIGVAGLANLLCLLKVSFGMKVALEIDEAITAAMYYTAVRESCKIGKEKGGFPAQYKNGHAGFEPKLQPDLWVECKHFNEGWEQRIQKNTNGLVTSEGWNDLRKELKAGNLRNSYLLGFMPTASSSNLVDCNEAFEPYTSNIYSRQILSGTHIIVNKYLINELTELGIWDDEMRKEIIRNDGSIQSIPNIPEDVKYRYKTARELDQRVLVLHSAARGPFICQMQSLNYFFTDITFEKVWSCTKLAWERGLKTGSYYIHSAPASNGIGTSLGAQKKQEQPSIVEPFKKQVTKPKGFVCSEEVCTACSG